MFRHSTSLVLLLIMLWNPCPNSWVLYLLFDIFNYFPLYMTSSSKGEQEDNSLNLWLSKSKFFFSKSVKLLAFGRKTVEEFFKLKSDLLSVRWGRGMENRLLPMNVKDEFLPSIWFAYSVFSSSLFGSEFSAFIWGLFSLMYLFILYWRFWMVICFGIKSNCYVLNLDE